MALSIKNPEADELARRLAGLTKVSMTDAVLLALREQLRREMGREGGVRLKQELLAVSDHCSALAAQRNGAKKPLLSSMNSVFRFSAWFVRLRLRRYCLKNRSESDS